MEPTLLPRRSSLLTASWPYVLGLATSCGGSRATPPPTVAAEVPRVAARTPAPPKIDASAGPATVVPCKVAGSGRVKGRELRVCVGREEDPDVRSPKLHARMRIEDASGKSLLADTAIMEFDPKVASDLEVAFRDVNGDGAEDVLLQVPALDPLGKRAPCRYVIDGAQLLVFDRDADAPAEEEGFRPISQGQSFAAAVASGPDPWSQVRDSASPIPKKDACALVKAAHGKGGAGAVVVEYREPGMPFCFTPPATRRAPKLAAVTCDELTCATDAALCRNHPSSPAVDYYLFAKGADGRFKIRAIAVYGGD